MVKARYASIGRGGMKIFYKEKEKKTASITLEEGDVWGQCGDDWDCGGI